jgi:CRISPR-associated protein Cpf1
MVNRKFDEFIGKYKLSKTLRFELKPFGETVSSLEDFKNQELIRVVSEDLIRSENYNLVKKIIDKLHRDFINKALNKLRETNIDLSIVFETYKSTKVENKEQRQKYLNDWSEHQKNLRKIISKCFKDSQALTDASIFKDLIPNSDIITDEEKNLAGSFAERFATYFQGFHENRKNMYKDEGSTAIAFRLVDQNLPKFFDNILSLKKIKDSHEELYKDLVSNIGDIDNFFSQNNFLNFLTQEAIDNYNERIAGKINDGNKSQGVNEIINLYKQKNGLNKLPKFSQLYKQILSETDKVFIDEVNSDQELLEILKDFQDRSSGYINELIRIIKSFNQADSHKIYIKGGNSLTKISLDIYGQYSFIGQAISFYAEHILFKSTPNKKDTKKIIDSRDNFCKQDAYKLSDLENILNIYENSIDKDELNKKYPSIIDYFLNISKETVFSNWLKLEPLLNLGAIHKDRKAPKTEYDPGGQGFQQIKIIQDYLDSILELIHYTKPLYLFKGKKPIEIPDLDISFYPDFNNIYEMLESELLPIYNKARNFLTKKPYSKEKIKINFSHGTLLNGWDVNKEKENLGILLLRNRKYYLGILSRQHKNIFDLTNANLANEIISKDDTSSYKKVFYKYLAGPNKMLPKVFFGKKNIDYFSPSDEIIRIRNTSSFTKNGEAQEGYLKEEFNIEDCHKMIDFYKESIAKHEDWRNFDFHFKRTDEYNDISEFYKDIDQQGYKISFENIKSEYIDNCVREGKLYLFEIYNKDFSKYSKGTPNLHTLYWQAVFEPWLNGSESSIKLNGQAEIFYRQHSIKNNEAIKHPANQPLQNKNSNNKKLTSLFEYEIVKDKRFTQDKFFFHVPIQLNYKNNERVNKFNDHVNLFLKNNEDVNIIGIDRGEKNLLYYTVINQSGEILEQASLNSIFSKLPESDIDYEVNYHSLLDRKEKERDIARKTWSTVENIKELKAGYLSHVVHKLAQLVIKYNAIVILEDLNGGFKRSRTKVEKQVYQKFELAFIKKLCYLVFKNLAPNEPGSFLNAYQLVPEINTLKDLNRQTGIVFYVNPAHTSKIDPLTGYVNLVDLRYSSVDHSKELFQSFDSIKYNRNHDYFEFEIDYKKIVPNKECGSRNLWTICTQGNTRYFYDSNSKKTMTVDVTKKIKKLLEDFDITFDDGTDIKQKILVLNSAFFYKELLFCLKLTMTLRHCNNDAQDPQAKDFILSPIQAHNGRFFDSTNLLNLYSGKKIAEIPEPLDSDANGAYHIAMKGLLLLERINQADEKNKLNMSISNKDWFDFIHGKRNSHLVFK